VNLLGKVKLALQLKRAADAVEGVPVGYSWRMGLSKAAKDFAITTGAVAGAAVLTYFADAANVRGILQSFPAQVQDALIPLLSSAAVFGLHWLKHRDDGS
jgi:hypothetical protein